MLSNDRGDPALTEMPVCQDFTPSLSPPSAPGAGGPRPLLPQDAHTLVALVCWRANVPHVDVRRRRLQEKTLESSPLLLGRPPPTLLLRPARGARRGASRSFCLASFPFIQKYVLSTYHVSSLIEGLRRRQ